MICIYPALPHSFLPQTVLSLLPPPAHRVQRKAGTFAVPHFRRSRWNGLGLCTYFRYTKHNERIVTTVPINILGQIHPWCKQGPFLLALVEMTLRYTRAESGPWSVCTNSTVHPIKSTINSLTSQTPVISYSGSRIVQQSISKTFAPCLKHS